MTKPIIAIDIDDVLADNAAGFVAYSNAKWGTNLEVNDYDEHWAKLWNTEHDIDETLRRRDDFMASGSYNSYTSKDRAYEVLKQLSERFELRIVTSRLMVMRDGTMDWLHEHYQGIFKDDTVHLAGIWDTLTHQSINMTKADVVKSIGAQYLIDDQLKHCNAAAELDINAVLFGDYGWNQAEALPVNVTRIADWDGVLAYFEDRA